jgi:WD repeat-containing protein 42A
LHFNDSGTKLVSGDDNGKIVVWNWAINRPQISFESGHVLNVFQVDSCLFIDSFISVSFRPSSCP